MTPSEYDDAKVNKTCVWTEDEDSVWVAECFSSFYFDDSGKPHDHGFKWCPFCGGCLKEVFWPDEEPDAS